MTAPELKPCPFCGAHMLPESDGYEHPADDTCPLDSLYIEVRHIAAWNTRATPQEAQDTIRQAVEAEREACADVVTACADAFAQVSEHPGVDTAGIRRSESVLRGIAAAIRGRGDA